MKCKREGGGKKSPDVVNEQLPKYSWITGPFKLLLRDIKIGQKTTQFTFDDQHYLNWPRIP